jgi:hypothetical protein
LARSCHAPYSVRPRRFSRPRRFAPHMPCRFVAPCSRPWGSPRFGRPPPGPCFRRERRQQVPASEPPFPVVLIPFRVFPSSAAPVTSPRPMPSRRLSNAVTHWAWAQAPEPFCASADDSTSRPCSANESVARSAAKAAELPDTPLGFPSWVVVAWRPDLDLRVQVPAPAAAFSSEKEALCQTGSRLSSRPSLPCSRKSEVLSSEPQPAKPSYEPCGVHPRVVDSAVQCRSAASLVRGLEPVAEASVSCPIRLRSVAGQSSLRCAV